MIETSPRVFGLSGRRFADFLLFGVTSAELAILFILTPTFTITDWIYVLQHMVVLGIAFTRRSPKAQDRSLVSSTAVVVAYGYSYAQVIYLSRIPGDPAWPAGGLVMVMLAAGLSLGHLLALGGLFRIRPARRGFGTRGPHATVRHPKYFPCLFGATRYNLPEWDFGPPPLTPAW